MKSRKYKFILLLVIVTAVCYANALFSGFVWDDINNVVNNDRLENNEGVKEIFLYPMGGYYRPLSYLSIRIDNKLWGKNPFGYHLTNILFHIFNVIIIFFLGLKLDLSSLAAFLSAVLFAIHPVHTEAVTYISGRSDLIAAFFTFLSFYFFIRHAKGYALVNKHLIISSILFILALFSKEIALIFPVLLICFVFSMIDLKLWQKTKLVIPFFIVGILFLLFWKMAATGDLITPSVFSGGKDIFKIILFYMGLLILPLNLHMQRNLSESAFLTAMPFYASSIIFIGILYILKKASKNKLVDFGVLWFFIGLFPFWGWLRYSAQLAEHWLYIPSLGLFVLAGYWGGEALKIKSKNLTKLAKIVVFTIVFLLGSLTIRQNNFWRNDITLYKYTLKFKVNDSGLLYNLGNAYLRRNMLDKAEDAYLQALRINPDYDRALNNLGIVFERKGEIARAVKLYGLAKKLKPRTAYTQDNLMRLRSENLAFAAEGNPNKFDHTVYKELLNNYTIDGGIDYTGLKVNQALLDYYLEEIAKLNRKELYMMTRQEKMALYINAYNAFTIKAIVDNYPVSSIKKIPGVWEKLKFTFAGEKLTLDEIEHSILRQKFKDARVHFALVCAAKGCPRLNNEPFAADNLDDMLEKAGQKFLNDKTRNRLDKQKNTLYLSSIFKWFAQDFGDVIEFISRYLNEKDVRYIKKNKPKIKYQYDWSLNEKK